MLSPIQAPFVSRGSVCRGAGRLVERVKARMHPIPVAANIHTNPIRACVRPDLPEVLIWHNIHSFPVGVARRRLAWHGGAVRSCRTVHVWYGRLSRATDVATRHPCNSADARRVWGVNVPQMQSTTPQPGGFTEHGSRKADFRGT